MYADLGTISHGTLCDADLLEVFADALDTLTKRAVEAGEISGGDARDAFKLILDAEECAGALDSLADAPASDQDCIEADERAGGLIEALADALDEYAPPYCYFGAHEGDGADFGFWFMPDALDQAERDGELVKLDHVPDQIAVVSDHGNVTLYSVTATEIIGVV